MERSQKMFTIFDLSKNLSIKNNSTKVRHLKNDIKIHKIY